MDPITALDLSILSCIAEHLRTPFFDRLFVFLTSLGDVGLVWIAVSLVMLCTRRYRTCGLTALIALLLSLLIVNLGIKPWVERPRPYVQVPDISLLIPPPSEFSFPSGHASSSFACAVVFFCFHHRKGALALLLAAGISFSRLYLYVHFPTDVLAGACIGALCGVAAMGVYWLARKHRGRRRALGISQGIG